MALDWILASGESTTPAPRPGPGWPPRRSRRRYRWPRRSAAPRPPGRPTDPCRRTRHDGRRPTRPHRHALRRDLVARHAGRLTCARVLRGRRQPRAWRGPPPPADRSGQIQLVARASAAAAKHAARVDRTDRRDVDDQRSRETRDVSADERGARRPSPPPRRRRRARRNQRSGSPGGRERLSSTARGVAPIAARSLRLTATALRADRMRAAVQSRRKCTPSTSASVVRTSCFAARGLHHRGIVADAEPRRSAGVAPARARTRRDERGLAGVGDGGVTRFDSGGAPDKKEPRFAVWGGR